MKMIDEKMDIRSITKTMIEFEKLKYLLFDSDQYFLFEHIPKPILFDKIILENQNMESYGYESQNVNQILEHNSEFWHLKFNDKSIDKTNLGFKQALERIKTKKEPNIIDERLIKIIRNLN